ncbi:MAG: adenylate/guanylate cyclase domain-containing protein [Gammaproteobacteria bacterium]
MTALLASGLLIALLAVLHLGLRKRHLETQITSLHRELQHMQQSCGRLAPPSVVQQLVAGGAAQTAERKVATVLFIDLVGYTALAERIEPAALADLLNAYFQRVHAAVTAHRGRIATYLGDGVLAYFGAFEPNPWQCDDAVAAALDVVRAMEQYADQLVAQGHPRLRVGIGIHRGRGLAGFVGSQDRMEYAFVGRTVNTAARVQTLTRVHECTILITDAVREELDPNLPLRALPPTTVKGIQEPLVTYEVIAQERSAAESTGGISA